MSDTVHGGDDIGAYLLNNTFDDIELVTSNDDLLALIERTQGVKLGLDAGPKTVTSESAWSQKDVQNICTYVSFATRSASTPTGQYPIAVTCPCTSMPPLEVTS